MKAKTFWEEDLEALELRILEAIWNMELGMQDLLERQKKIQEEIDSMKQTQDL